MSARSAKSMLLGATAALLPPSALAELAWNFPPPATPLALDILQVRNEFMAIAMVIFAAVFAVMIYSIVRHRKSRGHQAATFAAQGTAVQIFWTSVPFLVLFFVDFVLMGTPACHNVLVMRDTSTAADMVIKVTGSRWKWQYEYPDEGIKFVSSLATPREQIENRAAKGEHDLLEVDHPLVLPVGKTVRILLTSNDAVHTWRVPQLGTGRDAIPGLMRETSARIERPGIYRGQCAELCGKGHGFMPVVVRALPEADYRRWVARTKAVQAALAASTARRQPNGRAVPGAGRGPTPAGRI